MTEKLCRAESWWNQRPVYCHLPEHRVGALGSTTYRGAHCGDVEGHPEHFRWWEWGNERRAYSWTNDCPLLAREVILAGIRDKNITWQMKSSRLSFRWWTSETEYRYLTNREREALLAMIVRGEVIKVYAVGYTNRGGLARAPNVATGGDGDAAQH